MNIFLFNQYANYTTAVNFTAIKLSADFMDVCVFFYLIHTRQSLGLLGETVSVLFLDFKTQLFQPNPSPISTIIYKMFWQAFLLFAQWYLKEFKTRLGFSQCFIEGLGW